MARGESGTFPPPTPRSGLLTSCKPASNKKKKKSKKAGGSANAGATFSATTGQPAPATATTTATSTQVATAPQQRSYRAPRVEELEDSDE